MLFYIDENNKSFSIALFSSLFLLSGFFFNYHFVCECSCQLPQASQSCSLAAEERTTAKARNRVYRISRNLIFIDNQVLGKIYVAKSRNIQDLPPPLI